MTAVSVDGESRKERVLGSTQAALPEVLSPPRIDPIFPLEHAENGTKMSFMSNSVRQDGNGFFSSGRINKPRCDALKQFLTSLDMVFCVISYGRGNRVLVRPKNTSKTKREQHMNYQYLHL